MRTNRGGTKFSQRADAKSPKSSTARYLHSEEKTSGELDQSLRESPAKSSVSGESTLIALLYISGRGRIGDVLCAAGDVTSLLISFSAARRQLTLGSSAGAKTDTISGIVQSGQNPLVGIYCIFEGDLKWQHAI